MTYRFIEDPGHGWLEVPRAELAQLGISEKITPYSYIRGDMAYLEEDCDASTFVQAREAAGRPIVCDRDIRFEHQERTPIRGYARYPGNYSPFGS